MKKIRLGAGSAYWGDLLEPAVELADKGLFQGQVSILFLTFAVVP